MLYGHKACGLWLMAYAITALWLFGSATFGLLVLKGIWPDLLK